MIFSHFLLSYLSLHIFFHQIEDDNIVGTGKPGLCGILASRCGILWSIYSLLTAWINQFKSIILTY